MRKRVYVVYTGGTIGMRRRGPAWEPAPGLLPKLLDRIPELASDALPEITLHEYERLLDSSDVTPADWERIVRDVLVNDDHDGFVVFYGTDTMAYTASALSFLLEGLRKPVVLTGSQIPLTEVRNDARDNVVDALMVAGHTDVVVPEVCLMFGGLLLRGNRARKTSADGLRAFEAPNHRPLGLGGVGLTLFTDRLRAPAPGPLRVAELAPARVGALRLFPGLDPRLLHTFLSSPLQGVVVEAFGSGNAPTAPGFLDAIRRATERGVVLVACSQCQEGSVDLGSYAAGRALAEAGVVSGHDMTVEAAMTKLSWLLGQRLPPAEVRTLVSRDLRGELTPADAPDQTGIHRIV